ncbi:alpha/beta family hydrolase [Bacillus sp. FJAT-27445]|uniref:alpha/beta family hydrolase n=1 Tax=Bacillus sp. FJAT-27445 TaxID=1679166 RepID=UPI0007438E56|nr:alpha/beta family hydrolase [Bacillus sp. FJAT-27445]
MGIEKRTINQISYTYVDNQGAAVCFMFSGAGYTYDKPLLYYSTMAMLEQRYDVVHIHYSYDYGALFKLSLSEISDTLCRDIDPVITEVLSKKKYDSILFLGKSLGTIPIIHDFIRNNRYENSKMVLLTPLLKYNQITETLTNCRHRALIVIGKNDHHFIESRVDEIETNPLVKIQRVPNADHSLEIEPISMPLSLSVMEQVMGNLADFIRSAK